MSTNGKSPKPDPIFDDEALAEVARKAELASEYDTGYNAGWNKAMSGRITTRILKTIDDDKRPLGSFTATLLGYVTLISLLYAFVYAASTAWHEGKR